MRQILALPAEGETGFRLFHQSEGLDFRSDYEKGLGPRKAQKNALIHMGLTFWQTPDAALAKNRQFGGRLGDHLAVLELRADLGIWYAETFTIEHFTVWGRAGDLEQSCVKSAPCRGKFPFGV